MVDYATFKRGGVTYPLTAATTNSLLQDADPSLWYALDFLSGMLQLHIGARLTAQAALEGLVLANAVAQKLHSEPSPFLLADQFTFPALAIYRKNEVESELTRGWEHDVAEWEFAYLLPSLTPRQIDKLGPILRAAGRVIGHAIRQGWDPNYQSGAEVWKLAGLEKVRLVSVKYGGYAHISENADYFRAIVGTIEVSERDDTPAGAFESFDGADMATDIEDLDGSSVADVVDVQTNKAPTVTNISPSSGTKLGGTSVTLTGTGYRTGTTPQVLIGGAFASGVVVSSATQITCLTPAHEAYPTFVADVQVINADGQASDELAGAFTFTSP